MAPILIPFSGIPTGIFLAEVIGDWLTTFVITRSTLLLEIFGWPDLLLFLKALRLEIFIGVVYSSLANLPLPRYFTF